MRRLSPAFRFVSEQFWKCCLRIRIYWIRIRNVGRYWERRTNRWCLKARLLPCWQRPRCAFRSDRKRKGFAHSSQYCQSDLSSLWCTRLHIVLSIAESTEWFIEEQDCSRSCNFGSFPTPSPSNNLFNLILLLNPLQRTWKFSNQLRLLLEVCPLPSV